MIETWVGKNMEMSVYSAGLRIVRAVDQTWYPRLNDRPRAHAARFDGHIKSAACKPVILHSPCGLTKNDDFRVSRRVAIANGPVARARDGFSVQHQHRPNRNFSYSRCGTGLLESFLHEPDVGIHTHIAGE